MIYVTNGEPLVQVFFIFGDSIVDVGKNNNNLHTAVKSNFFSIGCMPAIITVFGYHTNKCVERINDVGLDFNKKLNFTTKNLIKMLSNVKLVIIDIYQPLYELIIRPSDYATKSNNAKPIKSYYLLLMNNRVC